MQQPCLSVGRGVNSIWKGVTTPLPPLLRGNKSKPPSGGGKVFPLRKGGLRGLSLLKKWGTKGVVKNLTIK